MRNIKCIKAPFADRAKLDNTIAIPITGPLEQSTQSNSKLQKPIRSVHYGPNCKGRLRALVRTLHVNHAVVQFLQQFARMKHNLFSAAVNS